MAATCSGRRVRASSPSASGSASQVCPISSTSTPRRVSIFISRAMTVCSSACSSSSVGAPAWTNTGTPSAPHRYTPSSTVPAISPSRNTILPARPCYGRCQSLRGVLDAPNTTSQGQVPRCDTSPGHRISPACPSRQRASEPAHAIAAGWRTDRADTSPTPDCPWARRWRSPPAWAHSGRSTGHRQGGRPGPWRRPSAVRLRERLRCASVGPMPNRGLIAFSQLRMATPGMKSCPHQNSQRLTSARARGSAGYNVCPGVRSARYCMMAYDSHSTKPSCSRTGTR